MISRLFALILSVSLALGGCGGLLSGLKKITAKEQKAIKASLEGWRLAGLPNPTECKIFSPPAALENPGTVLKHNELVVDDKGEPVIHEMMHVLYYCSGLQWWEPGNVAHQDKQVWIAGGDDVNSAQAIAERIYMEQ